MSTTVEPLPHLRVEIPEAARILRISRATLYERIREGLITAQKDHGGPKLASLLGRTAASNTATGCKNHGYPSWNAYAVS